MNTDWNITGERVLVIGDFHQKLDWFGEVLEREKFNYDRVVFLGDAFDSFNDPPYVAGVKEVAAFLKLKLEDPNFTWCIGNHDLAYREAAYQISKGYTIKGLNHYCSGYTNSKAQNINKVLTPDDWRKTRVFVVANGFLISHAGFRENHWRPFANVELNLQKLNEECQLELDLCQLRQSHLFQAGFGRGGLNEWGGPVWLDWDTEFEDNLPIKQIVGHTPSNGTVRQIGRSYCIDGAQSTYAIIQANGDIEFKAIDKTPISKLWVDIKPGFRNDDQFKEARRQSLNPNLMPNKPIAGFKY